MQNIVKISVESEDGVVQEFHGTGFVSQISAQEKSLTPGGMAKIIGTQITAVLVVPKEED